MVRYVTDCNVMGLSTGKQLRCLLRALICSNIPLNNKEAGNQTFQKFHKTLQIR